MLNVIFSLFFVMAIILLAITAILYGVEIKKKESYKEYIGVITDFYKDTNIAMLNDYDNTLISPVIEYEVDGEKYKFKGNYYNTNMKKGDEITILYDVNDYSKAIIESGLFFAPIVTGVIGITFLIIAGAYFIVKAVGII